jgi:hypothetical protein
MLMAVGKIRILSLAAFTNVNILKPMTVQKGHRPSQISHFFTVCINQHQYLYHETCYSVYKMIDILIPYSNLYTVILVTLNFHW